MKLQKLSALKALGMKLADDEHAEVTTGKHWDEPELGSLDPGSAQPRRTITTRNVSTVEQQKLAECDGSWNLRSHPWERQNLLTQIG